MMWKHVFEKEVVVLYKTVTCLGPELPPISVVINLTIQLWYEVILDKEILGIGRLSVPI